MDIGQLTHIGNVRQTNQDSLVVREDLNLFVVADGMGGHEGGEMASAVACEVIPQAVADGRTLQEALIQAHQAILDHPISRAAGTRAPGTTAVVVKTHVDGQAEIAWMGDSRIYLWRKRDGREQLLQVTRDHSHVQYLVDVGMITPEQARHHPHRNVITKALGMQDDAGNDPDERRLSLVAGDRLLLCTDGLNGEIEDAHIQDLLGNTQRTAQEVCEDLVSAALEAGGHDNVSVVVLTWQ